jgi:DNA polymerase III epsilon subunit-like protein
MAKNKITAVIDTETTGLVPYYHDVIQICIMPVVKPSFEKDPVRPPVVLRIKAKRPENADPGAFNANHLDPLEGLDWATEAKMQLCLWMEKYSIDTLEPIAQNYKFDSAFLIALDAKFFKTIIADINVRDTQRIATYLKDKKGLFPTGISLVKLAGYYGICRVGAHDAFADCDMTRQVYQKMLQE